MFREIEELPSGSKLISKGVWSVYLALGKKIPNVLIEIGRLREEAFQSFKGKKENHIDLDRYDAEYYHLFVYHEENKQVISAYRLGFTDLIINQKGRLALYSTSLYDFSPDFFETLGPAIELGRTFVRVEYQKAYYPLFLLLKGLIQIIAKYPRYRYLFGLISINDKYSLKTKKTIIAYLQNRIGLFHLSHLAKALHPLEDTSHILQKETLELQNMAQLDTIIKAKNGIGLPILLKFYFSCDTKLLSYGLDPDFGNCLDLLCVTDLATTDKVIFQRYRERINTSII